MVMPNSDPLPPGTTNPPPNSTVLGEPTYEYKVFYVGRLITSRIVPLNMLGREGWRVVARYNKYLLLERPLHQAFTYTKAGDVP